MIANIEIIEFQLKKGSIWGAMEGEL